MAMVGRRFGNSRKIIAALFGSAMKGLGLGYKDVESIPGQIFSEGFKEGFREARDTQGKRWKQT